jgi:tetratricopeptide (TPR) repeat protein
MIHKLQGFRLSHFDFLVSGPWGLTLSNVVFSGRWFLLTMAILMASWANVPAQADNVKVRAWAHPGFARIVFDWPTPVTFKTDSNGAVLNITFARPITGSYQSITQRLAEYVSNTSSGEGGTATVLTLRPGVVLRKASTSGKTVIVDLVRGAKPKQTAASSPAKNVTPSGKAVAVRVGVHKNYTRIVFDWTRNVDYSVNQQGDAATVVFKRGNPINLSKITKNLPARISSASTTIASGEAQVRLGLASGVKLRHFKNGTKVVVDVLGANTETSANTSPPAKAAPAAKAAPPAPAKPEQKTAAAKPVEKKSGPKSLLPQATPTADKKKDAAKVEKPKAAPPKKSTRIGAPPTGETLRVRLASLEGGGGRVSFAWNEPVAAAIFSRAGYVWAVFDRENPLDMTAIPKSLEETIFLAEQIKIRNYMVFRFRVRSDLKPVARRQGLRWAIEFRASNVRPAKPVTIKRTGRSAKDTIIQLTGAAANKILVLRDPEVGDTIHVAPVLNPGVGVVNALDFAQFRVLRSAQGAAVVPRVDDLRLSTKRKGLQISMPGGLAVSAPKRKKLGGLKNGDTEEASDGPAARIFNYAGWIGKKGLDFEEQKQLLQEALAKVPRGRRNRARWPLARFYFANHYLADASGVLNVIVANDPASVEDPSFRAIRGATRLLLGRAKEAEEDLLVPGLNDDPEISAWRGALFAQKHEWKRAYDEFVLAGGVPEAYSQKARVWLRKKATEAALRAKDLEMVNKLLIALAREEHLRPLDVTEIQLLRGKGFEAIGDLDKALENYRDVMTAGVRPTEARANFARINASLENREMTLEDATEELERLRFSWRGDDFEFELLRRLGDLYLDIGDYRKSLSVHRLGVTYFPNLPDTKVVSQEMNGVFKRLFLDGEADAMSAISALALFYDFRELTPIGEDGDEMIRQLATRLVSVDLLDRAAQLLKHQVEFRLKSVKKARVGLRLAVIYMLNRKFDKALSIMKITRWRNLPGPLAAERKQVEARILLNLEQPEDALLALVGDQTDEAHLIRTDIYWEMRRWSDVVETLNEILQDAWKGPRALTRIERSYVMKLAVALAQNEDDDGIVELRARYEKKMNGTPDSEGFNLITKKIDLRTTEFRKVAGAIAQINTLESFMTKYREKLYGNQVGN